ncbi:MAG: hypothetical protein JW726_13475 [Anaerolineales bacterium]|nr:hypothetical protein [Anaerolineales bacterium]
MTFHSILFETAAAGLGKEAPAFFVDLNLDQVVKTITAGKQEYDLKPFFYTPLHSVEAIRYRHEIMRDMETPALMESIEAFAQKMVIVRRYLGMIEKLNFKNHQQGWLLETVAVYCTAVTGLAQALEPADLKSRGLIAFREQVKNYARSDAFVKLSAEIQELKLALSTVKYCVVIKTGAVKVQKYTDETDYSAEVLDTFEKFKQGAVKDYRVKLYEGASMNHVEAQILDCVARLYPEIFASLDRFCARHRDFLDETIRVFDREIQFYVAYLEYIGDLKRIGLAFCYPEVSDTNKDIFDNEGFDLALAHKRMTENATVVCNDFYLQGQERIFIISGPNQGGKTTFARAFGQMHYLASLGCPVPGKQARFFLCDAIFTHFEKEENIKNLRGKLQDDLVRIADILEQATPNSIVIMNEIFTSTTLKDAVFLSKKIMERVIQQDALCVCVTFLDELTSLSEKIVSMVSTVVPENPAQRTFKIVRKPADGLAYALSIAEKHHLTYASLKERIQL